MFLIIRPGFLVKSIQQNGLRNKMSEPKYVLMWMAEKRRRISKKMLNQATEGTAQEEESGVNVQKLYRDFREVQNQIKSLRAARFISASISTCLSTGEQDKAKAILKSYNAEDKYQAKGRCTFVHPFNIFLSFLVKKGQRDSVWEILEFLQQNKIACDATTYGLLLQTLGSQPPSSGNTKQIEDVLLSMEKEGIQKEDVFRSISSEIPILAVQRVFPSFSGAPAADMYTNPLVRSLNSSVYHESDTKVFSALDEDSLWKQCEEQLKWEDRCYVSVRSISSACESPDSLYYSEKLLTWKCRWRSALLAATRKEIEALAMKNSDPIFISFLTSVPLEETVELMMAEVGNLCFKCELLESSLRSLHIDLGKAFCKLHRVHFCRRLGRSEFEKDVYRKYCQWFISRRKGDFKLHRMEWNRAATSCTPYPDDMDVCWPLNLVIQLGSFLYRLILGNVCVWEPVTAESQSCPAFSRASKRFEEGKRLQVSPVLRLVYKMASQPHFNFLTENLPRLGPPIPWTSIPGDQYLFTETNFVRSRDETYHLYLSRRDLGPTLNPLMDAMNCLGKVAWRINKPILDLISQRFLNPVWNEPFLNLPMPPKLSPAAVPSDMKLYNQEAVEQDPSETWVKSQNEKFSLWRQFLVKLSIAHLVREKVFWFPYSVDFRQRVYPLSPYFSHFDSDPIRSLLLFAEGKKLGKRGLQWLKLHLVNVSGMKKSQSITARLDFCEEIMDEIRDSSEKPFEGRRWWTYSSNCWQTLAACKELVSAIDSGCPEDYVSHLPIHQDGSCNAMQHYAALCHDGETARLVNLTKSSKEVPEDIYMAVLDMIEEERQLDAENGDKNAQALEGHLTRNVIKATVLPIIYGVSVSTGRLNVSKALGADKQFPNEKRYEASLYLIRKVFANFEKLTSTIQSSKNWLEKVSEAIAEDFAFNLEWQTPLGFPVVQPFMRDISQSIMNLKDKNTICEFLELNCTKQKGSFPPNFIHSLEATHLLLTALFCSMKNIDVAAIHDCYWTHAATSDELNQVCKEQFVSLYSTPVLEDLVKFLKEHYLERRSLTSSAAGENLSNILEQIPDKGNFDIQEVLKSDYFFK